MTAVEKERAAMLREFMHERMGFICAEAHLAQQFLALGDDAGLAYISKKIVAELKIAVTAEAELERLRLSAAEAATK